MTEHVRVGLCALQRRLLASAAGRGGGLGAGAGPSSLTLGHVDHRAPLSSAGARPRRSGRPRRAPPLGASRSTTDPPCRATTSRTIASPRPVPPGRGDRPLAVALEHGRPSPGPLWPPRSAGARHAKEALQRTVPGRGVLQRVGQQVGHDSRILVDARRERRPGRLAAQVRHAGKARTALANGARPRPPRAARGLRPAAAKRAMATASSTRLSGAYAFARSALNILREIADRRRSPRTQQPSQPEHDRQRRLELVANPGQQLASLLAGRVRPRRQRTDGQSRLRLRVTRPRRVGVQLGTPPVGVLTDHPRSRVGYVLDIPSRSVWTARYPRLGNFLPHRAPDA